MDSWYTFQRIFLRTWTWRIIVNFFELLGELFPYLLAGIVLAAILRRSFLGLGRAALFRSNKPLVIVLAALAGMLAPLPFYLAAPLAAVFVASGMPAPVALAFLVACPLIDPNLILLTWAAFGWKMTLARVLSAFILAVAGGLAWKALELRFPTAARAEFLAASQAKAESYGARDLRTALWRQSLFIARVFSLSLLISAALKALLPPESLRALLGGTGSLAVLAAIAAGIPFYQCGGASIPVMQALAGLGLSQGAVLAFFISGPATKLSSMYAFREAFGLRFLLLFVGYALAGAFVAGVLFNLLV
ncbi:permease [bacterium]|nr:permease [bacterium]